MRKSLFLSLNAADLYIVLWCIYLQQGALFSSSGIIFQFILLLLIILSINYALQVFNLPQKPIYFKGLNILLGIFSLYGIVLLLGGEDIYIQENGVHVDKLEYLKMLLISLLPIYAFYYFGFKGYITNRRLIIYSIVFVVLALNSFFYTQNQILEATSSAEVFGITNNVGYVFVSIIPLLTLIKRNLLKYVLFIVCLTFSYLSMKRGAFIISSVAGLLFLFNSLKASKRRAKIATGIIVTIVIFFIYYLITYLLKNNAYFQLRLEHTLAGEQGTRDIIYNDLWNHFLNETSIINILFGNGAFATTNLTINYAHNDWLEILTDQGVLGIIIYIFYWFFFLKTWIISKKQNAGNISIAIFLTLVVYFLKTLFSMSFNSMEIFATFTLGYCLSWVQKPRKI